MSAKKLNAKITKIINKIIIKVINGCYGNKIIRL